MSPEANPVPRAERRRSISTATNEEWVHTDRHRERKDPNCWFCTHRGGEHLDHDVLVPGCPDCVADAQRGRA